ncbi:MAG: excinuclease ABC subunit UvrC [Myxococcales bacterium]|nr:excinuclease ABC subunit UvrC [Myxococcales bacterium]
MSEKFRIDDILPTLPRGPGCYIMKDRRGEIVYVGKARDLRARIRSYFGTTTDTRFFVGWLDKVLGAIETIVCANEKEALILENELIKKHQPRFNVQLKDDKNFLHIRIDRAVPYPRIEVVRRRKNDFAYYFGPYDSATAIRSTLRILQRHFYLRTCPDTVFRNRSRPCLEHQIKRCPGPCVLPYPAEKYQEQVHEVTLFLGGRGQELVSNLKTKMRQASDQMEFELAAHYRDQILAIERSLQQQHIALDTEAFIDVIGLYREGPQVTLQIIKIRHGVVTEARTFPLGRMEIPDTEVVSGFVQQVYDQGASIPDEILLPIETDSDSILAEWLTEKRGRRVQLVCPQRGKKVKLVDMANRNAESAFVHRQKTAVEATQVLATLQERLYLKSFPAKIECYDISNIQGTEAVASMVVFVDGEPDKSLYRTFKMKAAPNPNDFLMMYEVIYRRFKKGLETGDFPNLVVIDGGKGQLNSARQALMDLDIVDIDIISLAKSRVTDTGDVSDAPEHSPERVFVPGVKNPLVLKQNSAELFLLTRLRDEAHRFAITFHKKLRSKRTLTTALSQLPGVGQSRQKALLKHFGSIRKVVAASAEDIAQVDGIGSVLAERIASYLNKE